TPVSRIAKGIFKQRSAFFQNLLFIKNTRVVHKSPGHPSIINELAVPYDSITAILIAIEPGLKNYYFLRINAFKKHHVAEKQLSNVTVIMRAYKSICINIFQV